MPKGQNPKCLENLRTPTSEEASAMGKKSGEVRRAKRNMQQEAKELLDLAMYEGQTTDPREIRALASMKGKNISVRQAILVAQATKAIKGDTTSAQFLRDTAGEKPAEVFDIGPTIEDYVKNHKVKF